MTGVLFHAGLRFRFPVFNGSRAGGLVRLPGSVGARPEGQSGAGLPVPVCHRVGLRRQLADAEVQSAGSSDEVGGPAGRLVGACVEVRKTPRNSNLSLNRKVFRQHLFLACQDGLKEVDDRDTNAYYIRRSTCCRGCWRDD